MKRSKYIILVIMFVFLLGFVRESYGAACDSDIVLSATYVGGSGNSIYYDKLSTIRLTDTACSVAPPPGDCWNGYNNVTLALPENVSTTSNLYQVLQTQDETTEWIWTSCNSTGKYLVNATLNSPNGTNCETNLTLNFTSASLNPNLVITFPTIPDNFTIGQNYVFNVTINNTGNDNATNINENLIYNSALINVTNESIVISNIPNGTLYNITFNVTFLFGGDTNFRIVDLEYSRSNGVYYGLADATSNTFHINYNPVVIQMPNVSLLVNTSTALELDVYHSDQDTYDTDSTVNWTYSGNVNVNISLNSTSRVVNITSPANWTGAENITFIARDLLNATSNSTFTIFVYNSTTEICNGIDDNGDTLIDIGCDDDGDDYCDSSMTTVGTPAVCPNGGNDCDDDNANIHPGATDVCGNNLDEDCSGSNAECPTTITNTGGGGSGGGGGGTYIPPKPSVTITSPVNGESFKINKLISFSADIKNANQIEWSFGDGTKSAKESATHSYSAAKSYTVTARVTDGENSASDSITIIIVECDNDNECAGLCCDGKCKKPACLIDKDCDKPEPYINEQCLSPGTCSAECTNELCSIECNSDADCNDNNPETADNCKNPSSCSAECANEMPQHIEEPKDVTPVDNIIDNVRSIGSSNPDIIQKDTKEIYEKLLKEGKLELEQKFTIANGKSTAEYKIRNSNIYIARGITVNVLIPKDIAENASEIQGSFITLEEDPFIQFIINSLKPGEEKIITYTIKKEIAREKLNEILVTIEKIEPTKEELDELVDKQQKTQNATIITTEAFRIGNKTEIKTSIKPKQELENVTIYLEIPKCLAETLDEIEFENKDFTIIKDDPIIAWTFPKIDDDIKLDFKVAKPIDPDCWKQIQALPIAELIKGRIYKKAGYGELIIILLGVVTTIVLGLFFAHHEEALKQKHHHGKHILHKDILKHTFRKFIYGFDHLFIALIIFLHVADFFEVLPPTGDFIKKILSWTLIGYLIYKARLSEIFFGIRSKRIDAVLLTAYFMLISKKLFYYITIANNEMFERGVTSFIYGIYQLTGPYFDITGSILFACGIILLAALAIICINVHIKSPSILAILYEEGRPSTYLKAEKKFITIFMLFFASYIIVFNFFMEWLAIAADATIAVIGLSYFSYRIIRSIIRIFRHHKKHLYLNKVFVGAGTFGEEVYEKFISLFHNKHTLLLGIGGILVFHLFVDVINFIIPYIFNLKDVLYFGRLGIGHSSMISLLKIILPYLPSNIDRIAITGAYILSTIALLFLLTIPFYIWYEILKKHIWDENEFERKIDFSPVIIGLLYASLTFLLFARTYTLKALVGKDLLGVDIQIINIMQSAQNIRWVYLIAIPIGIIAFIFSHRTKYRHILEAIIALPIMLFFYTYIILFITSWTSYYSSNIIHAITITHSSSIITYLYYILPLIDFSLYLIIILFYIGGLIALTRYVYMHWFLPRFEHYFAEKELEDYFILIKNKEAARKKAIRIGWPEDIVSHAYNHRRHHFHELAHGIIDLTYKLLMKLESKKRTDYSITGFDIITTIIVSIFPLAYLIRKIIISVKPLEILQAINVWVFVIVVFLIINQVFYELVINRPDKKPHHHSIKVKPIS